MYQLVLIRHGQSTWNLENRFTGWVDVDLTPLGVSQAQEAGRRLKSHGFDFDIAYTSVLKRAVWTLWHALDQLERTWLPVVHSWRLNERHYGALQGVTKAAAAAEHGAAAVRARLEKEEGLDRISAGIQREKTMTWLLDKAAIVQG